MNYSQHYEETAGITASADEIFDFIDDHARLSSHMNASSWMMAGGKMDTRIDEGRGKEIGSHIYMEGKVLGMKIYLDEVIIEHFPPRRKVWETVGDPNLLVISNYRMGIVIASDNASSSLTVFIDYALPRGAWRLLGHLFGRMYARWCVKQMLAAAVDHFKPAYVGLRPGSPFPRP